MRVLCLVLVCLSSVSASAQQTSTIAAVGLMQKKVNISPLPRGGASNTLNASHGNDRQSSGASFRMIVDTADWDSTVGTNSPGQSANPDSAHYADLFENWNKGEYFPMYYSKEKILKEEHRITILKP